MFRIIITTVGLFLVLICSPLNVVAQSKMYWTDRNTSKIQRSDLDGSNIEDLVTTGINGPFYIDLDLSNGKMYWTDVFDNAIRRANFDGSNIEDLVTGLGDPEGLALDVADGKMYWVDPATNKVQRADLNGANVEDLVTSGLNHPAGIDLDLVNNKMYWTNSSALKIQKANLDGSNVEDVIISLPGPHGIKLDLAGGKIYWTNAITAVPDKIQRANLDGSNVEDLVTDLGDLEGIDIDVAGGKMYWTDFGTAKIQRANLDGSNVEDLVTGLSGPKDVALAITPSSGSGLVAEDTFVEPGEDGVKMPITLINPGSSPAGGLQFELDFSGVVNATVTDLIIDPALEGLGFELKTNIDDGGSYNGILRVVIFNLNGTVIDPGVQAVAWVCFTADDIPPVPGPLGTENPVGVGLVIVSDDIGSLIGSSGEDGVIQIGIPGDVNLDGEIDIRDVVVLINAILLSGPQVPDLSDTAGVDFKIADLNGDGDVNVADVIGQVNHILGLPLDDGVPLRVIVGSPVVVDLGSAVSQKNGQLVIPVLLETSALIAGAQATFTFDSSVLTVGTPELVGNATNLLINSSVSGGTLRVMVVSLAKDQGLATGTTPMLLIPVTLSGGNESTLTLTELTLVNRQAQVVPMTMGTSTAAVTKDGAVVPSAFALGEARPNPFNPSTTIAYEVPQQAHITLTLYNLLGQEVVRLVDGVQAQGRHRAVWNGTNAQGLGVASGVYVYRLTSSTGYSETRRMTLLK